MNIYVILEVNGQIYQSHSTLVTLILDRFIWIQHEFQAITYNTYDYIKMSQ